MRNIFTCIVALALAATLVAMSQPPGPKGDNPAKPGEKPAKAAGKPAEGSLKLGVQGESGADNKKAPTTQGGLKFGPITASEKLIDEAVEKIESLKSYQSDVRQVVEMLGYKFTSDGRYAVAPDYCMLFELRVQLTDTTGSLLEVSDGKLHYRSQKILDTHELVKLDLGKVREIVEKPTFTQEFREELFKQLGFSGIVPLMRSLRETQKFDSHEEETMGDTPVYVLHGKWKDEVLSGQRGQKVNPASIPPYVPTQVTLWIGREDGWPHRLRMESSKESSQRLQGSPTVVTLEFLNPRIGVELPKSLFHFEVPEGVVPTDQTDFICARLNAAIQAQEASQKAKSSPEGTPGVSPDAKPATPSTKDKPPAPGPASPSDRRP